MNLCVAQLNEGLKRRYRSTSVRHDGEGERGDIKTELLGLLAPCQKQNHQPSAPFQLMYFCFGALMYFDLVLTSRTSPEPF